MVSSSHTELLKIISNLTQENVRLERENSELKRAINLLMGEKVIETNDYDVVSITESCFGALEVKNG